MSVDLPQLRCSYCRRMFKLKEGNLKQAISNLNHHITLSHERLSHIAILFLLTPDKRGHLTPTPFLTTEEQISKITQEIPHLR